MIFLYLQIDNQKQLHFSLLNFKLIGIKSHNSTVWYFLFTPDPRGLNHPIVNSFSSNNFYEQCSYSHELIESQFICLPYQSAKEKPFVHFTRKIIKIRNFSIEFINWEPNEQSKYCYLFQFSTRKLPWLYTILSRFTNISQETTFFVVTQFLSISDLMLGMRTHTQY